jgi:hypothetical protein
MGSSPSTVLGISMSGPCALKENLDTTPAVKIQSLGFMVFTSKKDERV